MSIASGFHPDPPSGTITTTTGAANLRLETRVEDGDDDRDVTLFTEYDAIRVPVAHLTLLADMLIAHDRELREHESQHKG